MTKVDKAKIKRYKDIAAAVRKKIVQMHAASGNSHVGSSLSAVEILVALYFHILKIDPKNCKDKKRDRLIFSKGHAASALYATLATKGFFPEEVLEGYCLDSGRLPGHVTMNCVPGIEASSGSLGHGLSMGIGMALAAKEDRLGYRTFVILSDGECQEGSVWEAAMFAGHHKLDNLIVIIDHNKIQAFGRNKEIVDLEPFAKKWASFGWTVKEIDGHNFSQILNTLGGLPFKRNKPSVVIAHTTKGKGVSFMEDKLLWHYKSPNVKELAAALRELDNR